MRKFVIGVVVFAVIVAIGLIWLSRRTPQVSGSHLNTFTDNGVQVDLDLEKDNQGQSILAARYTPLRQHFHVYSKDLAPNGVNGIGRPTILEAGQGLQATGTVSANASVIDLKQNGLDVPLPVYPDGPVTLRLPVKALASGDAEVKVGYMACSESTCLPPVEKVVPVTIPQ